MIHFYPVKPILDHPNLKPELNSLHGSEISTNRKSQFIGNKRKQVAIIEGPKPPSTKRTASRLAKIVPKENIVKCLFCSENFDTSMPGLKALTKHIQRRHSEKDYNAFRKTPIIGHREYQCPQCNFYFQRLTGHGCKLTGEEVIKANEFMKQLNYSSSNNEPVAKKAKIEEISDDEEDSGITATVKCPECRQEIEGLTSFYRHLKLEHGKEQWIRYRTQSSAIQDVQCPDCYFYFGNVTKSESDKEPATPKHNCEKYKSILFSTTEDENTEAVKHTLCPFCPNNLGTHDVSFDYDTLLTHIRGKHPDSYIPFRLTEHLIQPIKCDNCLYHYNNQDDYQRHYRGGVCGKNRARRENHERQNELGDNLPAIKASIKFPCPICQVSFPKFTNMDTHFRSAHSREEYTDYRRTENSFCKVKCDDCEFYFPTDEEYFKHFDICPIYTDVQKSKLRRRVKPSVIEDSVDFDDSPLSEIIDIANGGVLQCVICKVIFQSPTDYNKHIGATHTPNEILIIRQKCVVGAHDQRCNKGCGLYFARGGLKLHQQSGPCFPINVSQLKENIPSAVTIQVKPNTFSCPVCSSTFNSRAKFTNHCAEMHPTKAEYLEIRRVCIPGVQAEQCSECHLYFYEPGTRHDCADFCAHFERFPNQKPIKNQLLPSFRVSQDILTCKVCKAIFSQPVGFLQHVTQHGIADEIEIRKTKINGILDNLCTVCGLYFPLNSATKHDCDRFLRFQTPRHMAKACHVGVVRDRKRSSDFTDQVIGEWSPKKKVIRRDHFPLYKSDQMSSKPTEEYEYSRTNEANNHSFNGITASDGIGYEVLVEGSIVKCPVCPVKANYQELTKHVKDAHSEETWERFRKSHIKGLRDFQCPQCKYYFNRNRCYRGCSTGELMNQQSMNKSMKQMNTRNNRQLLNTINDTPFQIIVDGNTITCPVCPESAPINLIMSHVHQFHSQIIWEKFRKSRIPGHYDYQCPLCQYYFKSTKCARGCRSGELIHADNNTKRKIYQTPKAPVLPVGYGKSGSIQSHPLSYPPVMAPPIVSINSMPSTNPPQATSITVPNNGASTSQTIYVPNNMKPYILKSVDYCYQCSYCKTYFKTIEETIAQNHDCPALNRIPRNLQPTPGLYHVVNNGTGRNMPVQAGATTDTIVIHDPDEGIETITIADSPPTTENGDLAAETEATIKFEEPASPQMVVLEDIQETTDDNSVTLQLTPTDSQDETVDQSRPVPELVSIETNRPEASNLEVVCISDTVSSSGEQANDDGFHIGNNNTDIETVDLTSERIETEFTIETAQSISTPNPAPTDTVTDKVANTVTDTVANTVTDTVANTVTDKVATTVADTVDEEDKQGSDGVGVPFNTKLHDEVINGSDFHCLNKDCSFHAKFKDMIRHVREGTDNYL